ncbi:hypothetical protein [Streptomyces sp. YGL11-2]|uniref:hypothetical protein n=1 Tax=Streptomyces sp. YGL11-2 TaxID=3414028 RepID=UPI003CE92977
MNRDDLVQLTGRSRQRVTDAAHEVAQALSTRARVEDEVLRSSTPGRSRCASW